MLNFSFDLHSPQTYKALQRIMYYYSHFFLIVSAVVVLISALTLFFVGTSIGLMFKYTYIFNIILTNIFLIPFCMDVFSYGIYDYQLFYLSGKLNSPMIIKINSFWYLLNRFWFCAVSVFFCLFDVFLLLSLIHMFLVAELLWSFKTYVGLVAIMLFYIPCFIELFSYGWFGKSFFKINEIKIDTKIETKK